MNRLAAFALALASGEAFADTPLADRVGALDLCIGEVGAPADHADWCKGVVAEPCLSKPENASTVAMVDCIRSETEAWASILTREYGALVVDLDVRQQASLRAAQEAWVAFREADCRFPSDFVRGSLSRPWSADCMLHHTADRALALRGFRDYGAY